MEAEIKDALVSLLDAIKRSDGDAIAADMGRLDDFLARGKAEDTLRPQLKHFLERRSYAKALAFLDTGIRIPGTGKANP